MPKDVKQAAQLIKTGQYARARILLEKHLAENPNDARAWYLLSFTEKSLTRKLDVLTRAQRLAPDNMQIAARLEKLETTLISPMPDVRKRQRAPLLVGLLAVAVVVGGMIALLALNSGDAADIPLPTQKILPTSEPPADTSTPQEIAAATGAETAEATSALVAAAANAVTPETEVSAADTVTEETTVITAPTSLPPTTAALSATSLPATDAPATSAPPTNTPAAVLTATLAPATATLSPTDAPVVSEPSIPINQGANVGVGNLRVVAVTRPAADDIRELGGDIPDAPANQEWVLVEMLLRCTDESNCALSPSSFYLSGTSGQTYTVSPQFEMDPVLGTLLANGQIWGYLGFVVPKSDGDLRLVMENQNTRYVFAAS